MNFQNITLKGLRKLRNVPAPRIAEHIGISLKTYYLTEKNPQKFPIEQALKICEFLQIDISDYMRLEREATE